MQRSVDATWRRIWLLKLVLPFRYGGFLTGLLLLTVLLPFFYIGGESSVDRPPFLFFSLIIAYTIPIFSFITTKAQESLMGLRSILDLDDLAFAEARTRLDSVNRRLVLRSLFAGALSGCAHLTFIRGSVSAAINDTLSSVSGAMTTLGTLMVWIVMTTMIVMLIRQAVLFYRLGRDHTRVSLLEARKLLPFARVSISSSLAVIGALALFPLIGLESGVNLAESLPGAIAILGPLIVMFIIPIWPIHQRLASKKELELKSLDDRIGTQIDITGDESPQFEVINGILPLLNYRREISQISTWPFDLGNVTTMAFYLIIPPLTWAGAALIENLVDSLI